MNLKEVKYSDLDWGLALGEIQGFLDQAKHERVIKILKKAESSLKAELEVKEFFGDDV